MHIEPIVCDEHPIIIALLSNTFYVGAIISGLVAEPAAEG